MKKLKVPKELFRTATVKAEGSGADQSFRMSISSDVPYLRYDYWNDEEYYEVLSHEPGGCNEERLKAGLPILFNHDRDQHLGRATAYSNDGHRIEVTGIVWSESDFAQVKKADAMNGSLPDTSVGYSIEDEGELIGALDGKPIIRFKWAPSEASLVTVPADISVGVGRQRDKKPEGDPREISIRDKKDVDASRENENKHSQERENKSQQREKSMKKPLSFRNSDKGGEGGGTGTVDAPAIDLGKEREGWQGQEKARIKKINDYVSTLRNPQWKSAAAAIAISSIENFEDFDTFRTKALDSFEGVRKEKIEEGAGEIGMSEKEVKRFSFLGAIRQMASKGRLEGFEKESCDAAQKHLKRELVDARSFVIPEEVTRKQNENILSAMFRHMMNRAQNATVATAGGFTVEHQFGALIELLRNRTALGRLGITMIDGLVGDFVLPVQTGGATAYWVSETGSITDSEATFGQKALVPHRLGASVPYTMQFLAQTSLSADAFIRNEMDIVLALKKDQAGLIGTGIGGEPLGVANTTGINATVTYSGAADWGDVVEHETGIAVDNADIGSMGFVLDAAAVGKWKTKLKDSVAGAGYLITDAMTANGYPVERSNQISTAHQSFFGVWAQLMLGMWAGREITVDSITLAKSGQHQIIMNELCDYLVRQPLAFNVSTDSAAQ